MKIFWTLLVLIILVGGGWYVYNTTTPAATPATSEVVTTDTATNTNTQPAVAPSHDNIYLSATDTTKGTYMTDFASKTLYIFDKDSVGSTTCYGGCAKTWPPYTSGAVAQGALPTGITVITRADGGTQFAWNGMPLYNYAKDTAPNQLLGDGVNGTWHIIKM